MQPNQKLFKVWAFKRPNNAFQSCSKPEWRLLTAFYSQAAADDYASAAKWPAVVADQCPVNAP